MNQLHSAVDGAAIFTVIVVAEVQISQQTLLGRALLLDRAALGGTYRTSLIPHITFFAAQADHLLRQAEHAFLVLQDYLGCVKIDELFESGLSIIDRTPITDQAT